MDYTTKDLIEKSLQRELTSSEADMLPVLLGAIRIWINNKTDSNFSKLDEPITKYFDGGDSVLDVPPVQNISSIAYIDSYNNSITYKYETNEYALDATNQIIKRYGCFPAGIQNIAVTGFFTEYDKANGGVPEDIQLVATTIAASVIKGQAEAAAAPIGVKGESIEGHNIQYGVTDQTFNQVSGPGTLTYDLLMQRRQMLVG